MHVHCSRSSQLKLFDHWVMLMSVLRALVKNPIKESFYEKRKKKAINILTVFFISHKSDIKTFFNWILNGTR